MQWALVAPVEEAKTLCAAGIRMTPNTATIDIVISNSVRVKAPRREDFRTTFVSIE
jgi:hypothetical protein